jgi:hypothetical protein
MENNPELFLSAGFLRSRSLPEEEGGNSRKKSTLYSSIRSHEKERGRSFDFHLMFFVIRNLKLRFVYPFTLRYHNK